MKYILCITLALAFLALATESASLSATSDPYGEFACPAPNGFFVDDHNKCEYHFCINDIDVAQGSCLEGTNIPLEAKHFCEQTIGSARCP